MKLTKYLLLRLRSDGYTLLIAEGQADLDKYEFTPVKHDLDAFTEEHLASDLEDDMILVIEEAVQNYREEDYEGHRVVVPLESEYEINYAKLAQGLVVSEDEGVRFPTESFYGKTIRVPDDPRSHHETLTYHIQKYFDLNFVGKRESTTTNTRYYYLYELLPKRERE